jgi:hypothetical protein
MNYWKTEKVICFCACFSLLLAVKVAPLPAQEQPPAEAPAQADTAAAADTTAVPPALQPDAGLIPVTSEFDFSIGYNLKIIVRMAPVYQDSSLVSGIIAYLPKESVIGVLSELDNWYKIEFGPEENRQQGWVISYGVERTHELEYIVTNREDVNRWVGQRVIVVAGETAVRSFPSAAAEILVRAYRNEIFPIAGESQDYYMVELSNKVKGWVSRGDVEIYIEPKYSRDEVRAMIQTTREQDQRLKELRGLLDELKGRSRTVEQELETLQVIQQEAAAAAAAKAAGQERKAFFQFDSLKQRTSLRAGFLKQSFGSKLGLASTMFKGIGFSYRCSERISLDIDYLSGSPLVKETGAEQAALPSSLSGLDTLSVSGTFWQAGLRYGIGGLAGVPLLKSMDNYLYGGIGHLSLESSAAGESATQNFWGPVFGWEFGKRLFSRLRFEMGLKVFFTSAEVTDVRLSGTTLLQTEKVFLINPAFCMGVMWRF